MKIGYARVSTKDQNMNVQSVQQNGYLKQVVMKIVGLKTNEICCI